jgi:hypothetical protein
MSSAFYPLGMNSYNNRLPQGGYKPQKATGVFSNPIGITSGNIRPLTNKDPLNAAPAPFGKARPLKHYRRGINIPITSVDDSGIETYYYGNREVKSSVQDKMVQLMLDNPGRYIVKQNKTLDYPYVGNIGTNTAKAQADITTGGPITEAEACNLCRGVSIVTDYKPVNSLTERPQPTLANPNTCCNQQLKAKRRAIYASTNLKKNYYIDTYQYLYNRCQTYEQREFNFVKGLPTVEDYQKIINDPTLTAAEIAAAKPGSPLSYLNYYVANCNPNSLIQESLIRGIIDQICLVLLQKGIITQDQYNLYTQSNISSMLDFVEFLKTNLDAAHIALALALIDEAALNPQYGAIIQGPSNPRGCKRVYYKPNNPQFAQQGGVSSSTQILKRNVDTITTNAASINRNTFTMFKNKAPTCNPGYYIKNGNPKTCFKNSNDTTTYLT